MNRLFGKGVAFAFVCISSHIFAATSSTMPGSAPPASPTTSSTIPSTPTIPTPLTRPAESGPKTNKRLDVKSSHLNEKTASGALLFTSPGIVGLRNGNWVGSDNLFNLSRDIEVDVEIVKPENMTAIFIDTARIKRTVEKMLYDEGLNPRANPRPNEPPLPMLHFLILINPINSGYVASCSCRLFEPVTLKRINLQPGIIYQAITWEKQDLLILPADTLVNQLDANSRDLTKDFLERVKHYQSLQFQIRNQ